MTRAEAAALPGAGAPPLSTTFVFKAFITLGVDLRSVAIRVETNNNKGVHFDDGF